MSLNDVSMLKSPPRGMLEDYQSIFLQLGQTMKLLQGFLLLHEGSRKLFSSPCNIEVR